MELNVNENVHMYAKHCGQCRKNILLPKEVIFICIACGYNIIKREHELTEIQWKKTKIFNRLKYAQQKTSCVCVDAF